MNVAWISTQYVPDASKAEELWRLQRFIGNAHKAMSQRISTLSPFMQMVEREKHHNYFREKIRIIDCVSHDMARDVKSLES